MRTSSKITNKSLRNGTVNPYSKTASIILIKTRLISARAILEKITGSSSIKIKDWKKEIKNLESEISKLNRQSQSIKEEYENINHIKYAVKTVNDDYGIDLSIEIDKAIKRGEKPSVIAQIKKYQEQQEKYEQRKEKVKDYYRNEER